MRSTNKKYYYYYYALDPHSTVYFIESELNLNYSQANFAFGFQLSKMFNSV